MLEMAMFCPSNLITLLRVGKGVDVDLFKQQTTFASIAVLQVEFERFNHLPEKLAKHLNKDRLMEQYIEEGLLPLKWKSSLATATTAKGSDDDYGCNICLDEAQDPVVTLCGHLYCWPCIYKWLYSTTPKDDQQCPVCKSTVSKTALVPLYGRGETPSQTEPEGNKSLIPSRPKPCAVTTTTSTTSGSVPSQQTSHYPHNQSQSRLQDLYHHHAASTPPTQSGLHLHPMIGVLGEMVYTSVFGNTQPSYYWYPNLYQHVEDSSPRVIRRQGLQAEKSLNRISIFLLCCFVFCLLLF